MKYLLLMLVVLVVIWAVKRSRPNPLARASKSAKPATPANMLACAHCGIHLPQEEGVSGQQGIYCSTEHRAAAKDHNPL